MESIDCDDLLNSDEEYDDLESGQEASASDDGDSYTKGSNSDSDSDSDSNEKEVASQDEKNVVYGNFGWADAMSKVLKSSKPKTKKSVILSKAKKDADIMKIISAQQEKTLSFEVEEAKKENVTKNEDPDVVRRSAHLEKMLRRQRRKEWDLIGRVMPSVTEDRERERILSKIATRGVVQLFNSVKIQQKTIQDKLKEAGPLERKREKALKSLNKEDFFELLKGGKRVKAEVKTERPTNVKQEEATWSVLRDDFMPEVSMRDWDKQESSDSEDV
ncbi:RRP15-like protein [Daphnia carinata]|uniref:RRP15-like protein n=1 Tax=Daphnia carinata TaxID=120202 RepID=UPI00257E8329|nr:RRP15-like protein [Daphnia carinata]